MGEKLFSVIILYRVYIHVIFCSFQGHSHRAERTDAKSV